MKVRVQSVNFDNNRSVSFETINRKYHFQMHIHQFAELVIPISGELTVMVEDRTEILKPGQMAFIFPFQPHGYESKCKNELAILGTSIYNYSVIQKINGGYVLWATFLIF